MQSKKMKTMELQEDVMEDLKKPGSKKLEEDS